MSFINASLESVAEDEIGKYEDANLENKYPDFRYLMNEFHDGILLFEVSSKKVWNKVQEDSTGLKDYYEKNKSNYLSKKGTEAEETTLPFDQVKAEVLTGYQDWLTSEWIRQLTEKYPVKVDNSVFEEVKKRINNE